MAIASILKSEGYITDFSEGQSDKGFKTITLMLKFSADTPAITGIERHSKPGRRLYYGSQDIPRVLGGLGRYTNHSKGVMRARMREAVWAESLAKFAIYI